MNGPFIGADPNALLNTRVFGFRDVVDGLSNTAAFSEKVKGIGTTNPLDPMKPSSTVFAVAATAVMTLPMQYFAACSAVNPATGTPQTAYGYDQTGNSFLWGIGGMWHIGYPPQTRYNHVMPPNATSCSVSAGGNGNVGAHAASSRHPGIVNVMFCDGSVRAIKNTISMNTWWAIGTMNNGEVITADSF